MMITHTRRSFLAGASCFAAAAAWRSPGAAAAEQPETSIIRFADFPNAGCIAPQYIAADLLRGEGFTDFSFVPVDHEATAVALIRDDKADFGLDFASAAVVAVDAGVPVKTLGGFHVGCYALFAHEGIQTITDLKGKTVGVGPSLGTDPQLYVSAMATHVGLDPRRDINWLTSDVTPIELFAEHKIDALLAVAQEVQVLQSKGLGHIVVNGNLDRPWSQYFCCMLVARTKYVESNPIATKRILRAIAKGADVCVSDPQGVARKLIDEGHAQDYETLVRMLTDIPYASWRDLDPEDSIRLFSLRLREAGVIEASPQDIIARGTDWRFLKELKKEMKT